MMTLPILEDFLLPICICVLLPVAIVWICAVYRRKNLTRKAEVLMKALETGAPCDVDGFIQNKNALKRKAQAARNVKTRMHDHIQTGLILISIGGAFLVWWIVESGTPLVFTGTLLLLMGIGFTLSGMIGRKMFAKEIEAEEKQTVEQITAEKAE